MDTKKQKRSIFLGVKKFKHFIPRLALLDLHSALMQKEHTFLKVDQAGFFFFFIIAARGDNYSSKLHLYDGILNVAGNKMPREATQCSHA